MGIFLLQKELNQDDLWFGDEIKKCLLIYQGKTSWERDYLPRNTSSSAFYLHTEIWQMVLGFKKSKYKKYCKIQKSIICSALLGHTFFHTWNLHTLKTSEICLKPLDFPQSKHLHCSCTGLKPTRVSSGLGFSEKMVIYSPGGSYFCLGFLRQKYVCKNCTVARQWVHHCAMSQTCHARAKAKVIVTLVITLWNGADGSQAHNPTVHPQTRQVGGWLWVYFAPSHLNPWGRWAWVQHVT